MKKYYDERKTAIYVDLTNLIDKRMQTFKIISISAGTNVGMSRAMPGFIQPWVFELIKIRDI